MHFNKVGHISTTKICDLSGEKNDRYYRKREHEFHSEYVDGLNIVSYVPVCVYLSSKCMRNLNLLSAPLCARETNNGHIILPTFHLNKLISNWLYTLS